MSLRMSDGERILITIVLTMMFIFGIGGFISGVNTSYSTNATDITGVPQFNMTSNMTDLSTRLTDAIKQKDILGGSILIGQSFVEAMLMLFESVAIYTGIAMVLTGWLQFPAWFFGLLMTIIAIVLLWTVINIIFGNRTGL
jgi:hypothetical protein